MTDILLEIAKNKREEVASQFPTFQSKDTYIESSRKTHKETRSLASMIRKKNAEGLPGVIAEFKRRSPSKGDIAPMCGVTEVVKAYQQGGAAACSVLTDTRYFGGALSDLAVARQELSIPILRKDFIIDQVQIAEARIYDADIILLIASLLEPSQINDYYALARELGLEVLLEIHSPQELERINFTPEIIGVNNRSLSTFHTDVNHSVKLFEILPVESLKIAESGIKSPNDVERLMEIGYNGFLIGETFMRASSPLEEVKSYTTVTKCLK